jgi:hypothetical protein
VFRPWLGRKIVVVKEGEKATVLHRIIVYDSHLGAQGYREKGCAVQFAHDRALTQIDNWKIWR